MLFVSEPDGVADEINDHINLVMEPVISLNVHLPDIKYKPLCRKEMFSHEIPGLRENNILYLKYDLLVYPCVSFGAFFPPYSLIFLANTYEKGKRNINYGTFIYGHVIRDNGVE